MVSTSKPDYLLKPISFERLLQALNKLQKVSGAIQEKHKQALAIPEATDFLFIRADRKMVEVDFKDINYVESLGDYLKVHLTDKTIITRDTISNIEAKLPHSQFIRIHRSYIVAIAHIKSFTSEFIEVDKKALPISRSYKSSVLKKLENL